MVFLRVFLLDSEKSLEKVVPHVPVFRWVRSLGYVQEVFGHYLLRKVGGSQVKQLGGRGVFHPFWSEGNMVVVGNHFTLLLMVV